MSAMRGFVWLALLAGGVIPLPAAAHSLATPGLADGQRCRQPERRRRAIRAGTSDGEISGTYLRTMATRSGEGKMQSTGCVALN